MGSILNDIKKMLGLEADYDAFDTDVMIDINMAFSSLHQLGAGPKQGFIITGPDDTWDMFTSDIKVQSLVATYIYLKVKLLFDSPTTSFVLDAMLKQLDELAFRINLQVEDENTDGTFWQEEGGLDGPDSDISSPPWGEGDEMGRPEDPGPAGPPPDEEETY